MALLASVSSFGSGGRDNFTSSNRPAPTTVKPETLHKFSKLPNELRLKIWKQFHDDHGPRAITLHYSPKMGFYSKSAPPATFSVSRESRVEALRVFTHAFTKHRIKGVEKNSSLAHLAPIFLDYTKDVLYLQSAEDHAILQLLEAMGTSDLTQLRYLAINDISQPSDPFSRQLMEEIIQTIQSMSKLRRLSIITIDAWLVWDEMTEYEMQQVLLRGPGLGGVWQTLWETRSTYLEQMLHQKETAPWWILPDVHIASKNELLHMHGEHEQRSHWNGKSTSTYIVGAPIGRKVVRRDCESQYIQELIEFKRKHPYIKIADGPIERLRRVGEQRNVQVQAQESVKGQDNMQEKDKLQEQHTEQDEEQEQVQEQDPDESDESDDSDDSDYDDDAYY